MIQVLLQAGATVTPVVVETGSQLDILNLILHASEVVKGVMLILVFMSVLSWYVMGTKALYLSRALGRSSRFLDAFWKTSRLDDVWKLTEEMSPSPVSEVFRAGYVELAKLRRRRGEQGQDAAAETHVGDIESIERALSRARTTAMTEMESKVPFLATTASAAPFIGLFGTVWGIMNSFRSIGAKGAANLATVAPGIAEALVATAIGLVAAIPAVMGYNYLSRRTRVIGAEMESFANDFLNIIRRRFF
jgi:biopolymer transport protein TolQ